MTKRKDKRKAKRKRKDAEAKADEILTAGGSVILTSSGLLLGSGTYTVQSFRPFVSEDMTDGRAAAHNGEPLSANPYKPGTEEHREWQHGWDMGCHAQPDIERSYRESRERCTSGSGYADDVHPLWQSREVEWMTNGLVRWTYDPDKDEDGPEYDPTEVGTWTTDET